MKREILYINKNKNGKRGPYSNQQNLDFRNQPIPMVRRMRRIHE